MVRGDDAGLAASLLALKQRSGLSYGVLGRRLHLSTSTVHRYCSGEAVPLDYAPVERFARLCRATPAELVELHRQWILANEQRLGRPAAPTLLPAAGPADPPAGPPAPAAGPASPGRPRRYSLPTGPGRRRLLAAGATAALLLAVGGPVVALNVLRDDGSAPSTLHPVDAPTTAAPSSTTPASAPSATPSPAASPSHRPATATATRPAAGSSPEVAGTGGSAGSAGPAGSAGSGATGLSTGPPPLNVTVTPFTLCGRDILVDRAPAQVPPPPSVQDTSAWVTAIDGIPTGSMDLSVTVQGTGAETVVLQALHVRTVTGPPPARGTVYVLGDGCGGGVDSTIFDVDLDKPHPEPRSPARHHLPLKVSQDDPEELKVSAQALGHDVTWYLELDWSAGNRHGTLRIDDHGKPFRTTGAKGRPVYYFDYRTREWAAD
jgi:Helix-turn-helix domain